MEELGTGEGEAEGPSPSSYSCSVLPQVEEPNAGGGLLDRHCDQVSGDIGDKDVLNQAAGGFPVLAGLDGDRHVLTHSWQGS